MECGNSGKKRGKGTSLYRSVVVNADYIVDMEMSNGSKKRVRVDVNDSRWDKNYLTFLGDLDEYWETKFEEEGDDEDPMYAMFLENLKERGKGYMLGVSLEYGVCSPIMYEYESDPLVVVQRRSPRNHGRPLKSRKKDSSSNKERKSGVKKYNLGSEAESDSIDVNKTGSLKIHHGYNTRTRGRALEAGGQSKSGVHVCKVEIDLDDGIEGTSTSRQGSHIRKRGSSSVNRQSKDGVKNYGFVDEDESDRSPVIRRKSSRIRQDSNVQKKRDLYTETMPKSGGAVHDKKARETDETYNSFLAGVKVVGDSIVYESEDRHQILYEESVRQMSTEAKIEADSRQLTRSPAMPDTCTPISLITFSSTKPTEAMTTAAPLSPTTNHNLRDTSVTDKALDKNGKDSVEDHSKLWRKLRRILLKPFDQNEYNELLKDMSSRSRVQIYRESRSGGTYRPGHVGDSYLDKYPDLNDQIKKVKSDSSKVLNLLRMLSFYLLMIPHGFPKPWLPNYQKFLT
ncbi:hypothetical protein vseg_018816 [Gypsophila vaccaria]